MSSPRSFADSANHPDEDDPSWIIITRKGAPAGHGRSVPAIPSREFRSNASSDYRSLARYSINRVTSRMISRAIGPRDLINRFARWR